VEWWGNLPVSEYGQYKLPVDAHSTLWGEYTILAQTISQLSYMFADPTVADENLTYDGYNGVNPFPTLSPARLNEILDTDVFEDTVYTPKYCNVRGRGTRYIDGIIESAWGLLSDITISVAQVGHLAFDYSNDFEGVPGYVRFERFLFSANSHMTIDLGIFMTTAYILFPTFIGNSDLGVPNSGVWSQAPPWGINTMDLYARRSNTLTFVSRNEAVDMVGALPQWDTLTDSWDGADTPYLILRVKDPVLP
jgi:hypothetical protein